MTTLDAAPAALYREALAAQSDLINRPPLGVPRNTAFGTVQLNIASTVERTPSTCAVFRMHYTSNCLTFAVFQPLVSVISCLVSGVRTVILSIRKEASHL